MLFYIPPLLPVLASTRKGNYDLGSGDFFGGVEDFRVPMKYMAGLFSACNEEIIKAALKKLIAVRAYKQAQTVGNLSVAMAAAKLAEAGCSADEAEAIYRLTALPRFEDRFVMPPYHREEAIGLQVDPIIHRGQAGLGFSRSPKRGP
jgi:nitrate reductase beta subunit